MTQKSEHAYRIYLVDDDRFLLDMYALKFKASGHDVSTCTKGEELVALLKEQPEPDAILLDVVMPGMSGFDALAQVRKERLLTKGVVIMLTNQGSDADLDRAKELDAAGYIIKASAIPSEVVSQTMSILAKRG
jgi:DNA-binding response OmpR family regulator